MRLVILAWQHVAADPGQFRDAVLVHLELSALALLIAFVLALPAGIWVSRWPTAALVTLGAANTLRTIPSLAVLAFTLPFLGIVDTVERVLAQAPDFAEPGTVEDVLVAEAWARETARALVAEAVEGA